LGYIGIVQHKEHSPEVLSILPGTSCIYIYVCVCVCARARARVIKKSPVYVNLPTISLLRSNNTMHCYICYWYVLEAI